MKNILEVIGFTIEGCYIAQAAGANRIELCDNPGEGGTTPSKGFISAARKALTIDLFPIIRPRGGDFLYSDDEFAIMKEDIRLCKQLGCDGIVTGILMADGTVDTHRCSELVALAYPMEVTFHRAFDRTADPFTALETIIETGCTRILTSGQKPVATDGLDLIKQLHERADDRIIIMPGSGVRADNVASIAQASGTYEFHTSARILSDSKMQYQQPPMNETLKSVTTDGEEIKKIKSILDHL